MMSVAREAITDSDNRVDVSYLALFCVMIAVLGAIFVMCLMSIVSFIFCTPEPALPCRFEPQPLGVAIGAVCVGFATALGALAAYMVATRKPSQFPPPDVIAGSQVNIGAGAGAPAAAPAKADP